MPELTLWLTRNIRTDSVKRSIAGISNISDYDSPEKWEETINQKMTNLIIGAADSIDQRMDWSTSQAFILLIMFWPIVFATAALTYWLK